MRLVCISDTHNKHGQIIVPDGDVLVHAGDATMMGSPTEITAFYNWFVAQPHKHKVLIAGNHDWLFYTKSKAARRLVPGITYIRDQGVEIDGLKFWGSPWQPWFNNWAFNADERELAMHFRKIPAGTDVLITHGPPAKILDQNDFGTYCGSISLLDRVLLLKPKLHVFGHIHEGYGQTYFEGTCFVNASICTGRYAATNQPIVVDL